MYDINTCDHPIEIYISVFHLRHLCISTRLVKATHNIKTSLMKQCYIWYAWPWLIMTHCAADTDMLLTLLPYWYCYRCWYCYWWSMYALYYMLNVLCLTSIYIYITTVLRWNHAAVKSRLFKTKQIQYFIQHFEIIQNLVSL
jgi:hypothetical protein